MPSAEYPLAATGLIVGRDSFRLLAGRLGTPIPPLDGALHEIRVNTLQRCASLDGLGGHCAHLLDLPCAGMLYERKR